MSRYSKAWWIGHWGVTRKPVFRRTKRHAAQESALLVPLCNMPFASVLEVGCGFGRITRLVVDAFKPRAYLATDVSQDAINRAHDYCADRPINFRIRDLDDFGCTPQYDLVLAAEVLMHRRPDQIAGDVRTLAEHAIKYVMNVDWYEPDADAALGCYQHDYAALFAPYGMVERIDVPSARQAIWVTRL